VQNCPKCGVALRYIPAGHSIGRDNPGVYTVEAEPITLISERGRSITGYKAHICGESNGGGKTKTEKSNSKEKDGSG
jgi:hypothetical protein